MIFVPGLLYHKHSVRDDIIAHHGPERAPKACADGPAHPDIITTIVAIISYSKTTGMSKILQGDVGDAPGAGGMSA